MCRGTRRIFQPDNLECRRFSVCEIPAEIFTEGNEGNKDSERKEILLRSFRLRRRSSFAVLLRRMEATDEGGWLTALRTPSELSPCYVAGSRYSPLPKMFTPSIPGRVVFKRNARGGRQILVSLSQNERSTFSRVTPVFVPSLPVWGRGTPIFPDKTVILTNPNAVCPKNDQMTNPATEKPRMTRIPRTSSYGGSHGGCESTDHRSPITDHSVRAKQRDPESIRGFTLLELLIVVGIIGLLLALIAPAFTYYQRWKRRHQRRIHDQRRARHRPHVCEGKQYLHLGRIF